MLERIKNYAIVSVLSLVVFIATGVVCAGLGGIVLGTTINSSGDEELKGGGVTTLAILAICLVVSIIFAVWLQRLLVKVSKNNEAKSDEKE